MSQQWMCTLWNLPVKTKSRSTLLNQRTWYHNITKHCLKYQVTLLLSVHLQMNQVTGRFHLQDKEVSADICQRFEELCEEYGQAFSKHNEDIGRTKFVKMDIDTGDSPPVSSRPYTLPLKHYEWVQREIESLEQAGVITKSMSKWASPIVVVPKKSAPREPPKRRLCIDFRKSMHCNRRS